MQFGLMIIGDEIVQGNRTDAHFSAIKQILAERGLRLAWVEYLCDDRAELVERLRRSFAQSRPVLVTGGIGATPDDHTRQAAAQALGRPLLPHAQAISLIDLAAQKRGETDFEGAVHLQRRQMGHFVEGASIIPNPFNGIAGFSIHQHYFMPGFPVMAHPMVEWVLSEYYSMHFHQDDFTQRSTQLFDVQESQISHVMSEIEARYPGVQTYSLPSLSHYGTSKRYCIELGLKAEGKAVQQLDDAWTELLSQVVSVGGAFE